MARGSSGNDGGLETSGFGAGLQEIVTIVSESKRCFIRGTVEGIITKGDEFWTLRQLCVGAKDRE